MRVFTWRLFIAYTELLLAFCLVLSAPAPGRCQSSTNYYIHAHVLDSGGGTCRSGSHKMVFSLGQTSADYIVESGSQSIFTGFIMSRNGLAGSDDASDSGGESGTGGASESGGESDADDASGSGTDDAGGSDDTSGTDDAAESDDASGSGDAAEAGGDSSSGSSSGGGCFISTLLKNRP